MNEKARQYKPNTVRRLDTLAGNECSAPDCTRKLIARDGETLISKICHIEAASPKGARYNPGMNDDERRHFDNLILLCDECHGIIDNKDNEDRYPVSLLREWKKSHEGKMLNKLNTDYSLLKTAINAIASTEFDLSESQQDYAVKPFNIDEKIDYNSVKRNRTLIEEYKVFYSKLNTLYSELEIQGSFKKEKLLKNIKQIYLKVKGKYIKDAGNAMRIIKNNSDNIIEDVEEILVGKIKLDGVFYREDIEFGISIIMVDAFMRCKILEEPEKT